MSRRRDDDLMGQVCEHIAAVAPTLPLDDIRPEHSLTNDLGLDSLRLSDLVDRIRKDYPDIDLMPWLVAVAQDGEDTLASLVAYVDESSQTKAQDA